MIDCIFCKVIDGSLPSLKVYEDDTIAAFLDIRPVNPGDTLVVPKEHTQDILKTSPATIANIMNTVPKIATAIMKATGADGFHLSINTGASAGQTVPHLHVHVTPRHMGDGRRPWPQREYATGEGEEVAEKIRQSF